jgi:hypothetical protein
MALCGKDSVNFVTLCRPLPYGRRAAPSKKDGRTLEKGMDAYPMPTQDNAVTSGQRSASFPSPPAPCGHPRHCSAIPSAVGTQDDKTPPRPLLCTLRPPISRTLESAYEQRPNRKFPHKPLSKPLLGGNMTHHDA